MMSPTIAAIRKSRHANWTWKPFWQEQLIDEQSKAAASP